MRLIKILSFFLLISLATSSWSQPIQHWETVVYDSMQWRYWVGTSNPGATWNTVSFNDAAWPVGRGGIGYGDGDDRTVISPVLSVFLRKKFTLTNRDKILDALLHVDYDDGFIAYLNGVEIARAVMPTGTVAFNQPSAGLHEALLYQNQAPEGFLLKATQINSLLVAGENTLAVQVHNDNINSSDLSSRVFFSVGITDNSQTYLPTPAWFTGPFAFTSSNLPVMVITTQGQPIPDDPRIPAHLGIIDNGPGNRNTLTDPFTNYDGRISIETRGESSQMFPKKSYSIETQTETGANFNAALLGMPPENDWVLYAPYTDKTMLRDVLAFQLGQDLGHYAPRYRFVELVINDDYKGVYVLMEKIKRDKNRVDIAELQPQDLSGDEVTGGYVLRIDKIDGNDYPAWTATPTPMLPNEQDVRLQYFDPAGEKLVDAQRNYIRTHLQTFQSTLTTANFTNHQTGYRKYLDVPSAVDFILVNELGKNVDAFLFSTYLYKAKDSDGGKLFMGPLWDFNLAFGNVDYLANAQFAPGWMYADQGRSIYWFRRMVQDPDFATSMTCRWVTLRSGFMTNAYFMNTIDSLAAVLQEAQVRNFQRWPILGTYVWPNQFIGQTYAQEIGFLKQWILERLAWMDNNMPGNCAVVTGTEPEAKVEVFPNPFQQSVRIRINSHLKINTMQVVDLMGREVIRQSVTAFELEWDGRDAAGIAVAPGMYLLRVFSSNGALLKQVKLIKTF